MQFTKISNENISLLKPYLFAHPCRNCAFTPLVLVMWSDFYDYHYALEKDALFLKMRDENGEEYFFMPVCEDIGKGVEMLRRHCRETGEKLRFFGVGEEYVEDFCKWLNAKNPVQNDDWADYIYDAQAMKTLVGKKYNGKRNHVNRFYKSYPDAKFVDFTEKDRERVKEFVHRYHKDDDTATYSYDIKEVLLMIENWRDGEYLGGFMETDGQIVGFSVGEVIGDTLFVHVEKCLRAYSGVYEATCNAFLNRFADDTVKYVNREEDMGYEGLRKSKMSYHPLQLLKKYLISEND